MKKFTMVIMLMVVFSGNLISDNVSVYGNIGSTDIGGAELGSNVFTGVKIGFDDILFGYDYIKKSNTYKEIENFDAEVFSFGFGGKITYNSTLYLNNYFGRKLHSPDIILGMGIMYNYKHANINIAPELLYMTDLGLGVKMNIGYSFNIFKGDK